MASCKFFYYLSLILAVFLGGIQCHEITNSRQITDALRGYVFPKFSPRQDIISYRHNDLDGKLILEVNVTTRLPDPQLILTDIPSYNLGYLNESHMVIAVKVSSGSRPSQDRYMAAAIDRQGQVVHRYSNYAGSFDSLRFGFKDGYVLGLDDFDSRTPTVLITNVLTAEQTSISTKPMRGYRTFAVFHPTANLVYYSVDEEAGATVYSCEYSGNNTKIVYRSQPGNGFSLFGVSNNGNYLVGCMVGRKSTYICKSGLIRVESGTFEYLTLNNKTFDAQFHSLSPDGKYLAYVRSAADVSALFVADWHPESLEKPKSQTHVKRNLLIFAVAVFGTALLIGLASKTVFYYVKGSKHYQHFTNS